MIEDKFNRLKKILSEMESVLVAFSGGVDSTFLLKAAKDNLPGKIMAVTAISASFTEKELKRAKELVKLFGVKHVFVHSNELDDEKFTSNPPDKCYYCKKGRFSKLVELAEENNLNYVIEGANIDDLSDFRPGMKAVEELGVRSPLKEAGLTKKEIRELSKDMDLVTWNASSQACLATRIALGTTITRERLKRVESAEDFITGLLDLEQLRVRDHDGIARIEVPKNDVYKFFKENISEKIATHLKTLGYKYVSLDLEGYRTGSMNEHLP
ncbi:ATP-dependent sacrificial sulfur transferase LarE [candidate division KSB1 bacterium]